jgi:hypothetical protein
MGLLVGYNDDVTLISLGEWFSTGVPQGFASAPQDFE